MTTPLKDLLNDVIKRYGLEHAIIREQMPRIWAQMVGPRIARISEVRSFENGVLNVRVREAAWRSELMLRRELLRNQLNTDLGSEIVKEIIVR
jgi:predicted nucleic acid-binding Zn ribbon protein